MTHLIFREEFAMSTVLTDASPTDWTIADVEAWLPGFPRDRIRIYPPPGTATDQDVLAAKARNGRICELIDGTLVEKPMATQESMLALVLAQRLLNFLDVNDLGMLTGEAGFLRILPGQIRAPDVSVIRWERLPDRHASKPAIYAAVPDLAVEILSDRKPTRKPRWIASCTSVPSRRAAGLADRAQEPHGAGLHGG